jgi:hypothetical protein
MYLIRKYHQQIERFICAEDNRAFIRAWAVLLIVFGIIAGLIFKFGAPAMNGKASDNPIFLDGAWRILNGQVPHRDFNNVFGDLPFYMTALGMKLNRPGMAAIDYGNVVMMAVLVSVAMLVLRRRTSAFLAFFYSAFIGLLVLTPRPLGDAYDYIGHAMIYNRYGEAFIAILGAILFLPPKLKFARNWAGFLEAILAGFMLAGLLGCKVNYFAIGLFFFGVSFLLGRIRIGWALLCVCSAVAFLAVALILTKIRLSDLLNDYRIVAACQKPGGRIRGIIIQGTKNILVLPVLLLPIWEFFLGEKEQTGRRRTPWRDIVVVISIFGGALLLLATNTQIEKMPLLALAALYGAELIFRQASAPSETAPLIATRHLAAILLVLLFVLPSIIGDLKTIRFVTFAAAQKNWDVPEALKSTNLNDFRFVRDGTRRAEAVPYMEELNDGIELLRRHADPAMRLNALLYSDPYEVALGLRPASGGTICVSINGFTKRSHPALVQLLGNATHILTTRGAPDLKEIYGDEWNALPLQVIEETKYHTLFKIAERQTTR